MKIRFLEIAERELDNAAKWYSGLDEVLGLTFLDEIDRAIRRILQFPFASTEIQPGIRRGLLSRFPYAVICGLEEDTLIVIAIAHLRRRPQYWIDRV